MCRVIETTNHIILDCPRFAVARHHITQVETQFNHLFPRNPRQITLQHWLGSNKGIVALAHFLSRCNALKAPARAEASQAEGEGLASGALGRHVSFGPGGPRRIESHVAGEFDSAPLDLAEVDGLGISNLSQAALAHWNYAKSTIALVPCDQCTKGAKPCLVHTGPASCFLCLKAKAKCSLVPEKPKGKPKGKGKGKAEAKDEELEVLRSKKGKKLKKTEDTQE
ncbi:hypothetical protein H0H81_012787 [Sphagnurus paluster]|uniref:Uncharacterized protein n=1 Tax=Sphagnurus paluster TaxID=117069 RepID=A0A9P7FTC4_9AGAR|nr:hypothetical protein H0H81_012787 [Sphagnurus paluster]